MSTAIAPQQMAGATVFSSREQARQSFFRQRTANLVDLLRQQNCICLELFDVVSGPFAFELFQIGDAGVKAGQLNVKVLNFRLWIPSELPPASRQSHRRAPCCRHAFVNSICGGMENYSRQTWTDHATFFVGGSLPSETPTLLQSFKIFGPSPWGLYFGPAGASLFG